LKSAPDVSGCTKPNPAKTEDLAALPAVVELPFELLQQVSRRVAGGSDISSPKMRTMISVTGSSSVHRG
jgi:hypothetical protein